MEIKIDREVLATKKLFLATPMYGGQCHGMYSKCIADLSVLCFQLGIQLQLYLLFNESLITRARNYACDEFMRSDATHFMFIDADIGFDPKDIIALLALQTEESPYDVIGGTYPKKTISWEKIKIAVDKGFADTNPNDLERFVGDYVFNPKAGVASIPISEPCEVLELGTGHMMIKRSTFERYAQAHPENFYRPDHVRTEQFDGSREICMFFQAKIDEKSKRYLSEDYLFCQEVQELGMKVWLCPFIKLQHAGSWVFGGSLADIAALGVSPTADVSELQKHRAKSKEKEAKSTT